jgi:hypothetical protein
MSYTRDTEGDARAAAAGIARTLLAGSVAGVALDTGDLRRHRPWDVVEVHYETGHKGVEVRFRNGLLYSFEPEGER